MLRAVDVSEWSGHLPAGWAHHVATVHSVRHAIVQAWGGGNVVGRHNSHIYQQVSHCVDAGWRVALYGWPPADTEQAVRYAWNALGTLAFRVDFWAHDVEAGADVSRFTDVDAARRGGFEPWIYTSPAEWNSIMGGTGSFQHLPLWLAHYPYRNRGDVWWPNRFYGEWQYPSGNPFDARIPDSWSKVAGWQFQGTTTVRGVSCDLNVFQYWPGKEASEMQRTLLVKAQGRPEVLYTDGIRSWHVPNVTVKEQIRTALYAGGQNPSVVTIPDDLFQALWERTRS